MLTSEERLALLEEHLETLTPEELYYQLQAYESTDKFEVAKAEALASKAHEGQMYGEDTYYRHLYDVVLNLNYLDAIARSTQEVVAYLHDIIEDTPITREYLLANNFSDEVVEAVDILTKKQGQTLQEYITLVKSNPLSLVVKKSDTLSNLLASYQDGNSKRIIKYSKQLAELYKEVL